MNEWFNVAVWYGGGGEYDSRVVSSLSDALSVAADFSKKPDVTDLVVTFPNGREARIVEK